VKQKTLTGSGRYEEGSDSGSEPLDDFSPRDTPVRVVIGPDPVHSLVKLFSITVSDPVVPAQPTRNIDIGPIDARLSRLEKQFVTFKALNGDDPRQSRVNLLGHAKLPPPEPVLEKIPTEEEEQPVNTSAGLTIPKYDEQLRIIRQAIVDLRSVVQQLRLQGPIVIPGRVNTSVSEDEPLILNDPQNVQAGPTETTEGASLRQVRQILETHFEDVDKTVGQLRQELYTFMAQYNGDHGNNVPAGPSTPVEPGEAQQVSPPKKHPGQILVIDDPFFQPKVIGEGGELGKLPSSVIVTPVKIPTKVSPGPPAPPDPVHVEPPLSPGPGLPGPPGIIKVKPTEEDQPVQHIGEEVFRIEGHEVPQLIRHIRIMNANPEQQVVLDALVPAIGTMQTQMAVRIDAALAKAREAEEAALQKVDKVFFNDFFRNIRMNIIELTQQLDSIKQQVPDRVTRDELKDFATELYTTLSKETPAAVGVKSYNCLFCGQPRSTVSGMITDQAVANSLGEPQKVRIGGTGGTIMYGSDKQMYIGRGNLGRPTTTIPKIPPLRPLTANPNPS
jgi:hypothetical protein